MTFVADYLPLILLLGAGILLYRRLRLPTKKKPTYTEGEYRGPGYNYCNQPEEMHGAGHAYEEEPDEHDSLSR